MSSILQDTRSCREDIINVFVEEGKKTFAQASEGAEVYRPRQYTEANVLHWLYFASQEAMIALSSAELHNIVDKVLAAANKVMYAPKGMLTAGILRKSLEGVPDNALILYQRIEDAYFEQHGWTTTPFVWETHAIHNEALLKEYEDNPSPSFDIKDIGGKKMVRCFSPYIAAHSAWTAKNDEGDMAFVINAHY